jgi:hypothetical protein
LASVVSAWHSLPRGPWVDRHPFRSLQNARVQCTPIVARQAAGAPRLGLARHCACYGSTQHPAVRCRLQVALPVASCVAGCKLRCRLGRCGCRNSELEAELERTYSIMTAAPACSECESRLSALGASGSPANRSAAGSPSKPTARKTLSLAQYMRYESTEPRTARAHSAPPGRVGDVDVDGTP